MKKLTLLITVIFTLFMFIGNLNATTVEPTIPVPDGYTLISHSGLYSSQNIDFNSFSWAKGSAAYSHQLNIIKTEDGNNFYLDLRVTPTSGEQYNFLSKDKPVQFQTYQHENGGYFWLIEDIGLDSNVNQNTIDYNDLWAKVDVVATPVPAAVWLFGSGLVGLVGLRRRMNK